MSPVRWPLAASLLVLALAVFRPAAHAQVPACSPGSPLSRAFCNVLMSRAVVTNHEHFLSFGANPTQSRVCTLAASDRFRVCALGIPFSAYLDSMALAGVDRVHAGGLQAHYAPGVLCRHYTECPDTPLWDMPFGDLYNLVQYQLGGPRVWDQVDVSVSFIVTSANQGPYVSGNATDTAGNNVAYLNFLSGLMGRDMNFIYEPNVAKLNQVSAGVKKLTVENFVENRGFYEYLDTYLPGTVYGFHFDWTPGHAPLITPQFSKYPNIVFQYCHFGGGPNSGFANAQHQFAVMDDLLTQNANMVVDASWNNGFWYFYVNATVGNPFTFIQQARPFFVKHADRVLWGSDWVPRPDTTIGGDQLQQLKWIDNLRLPASVLSKVLGGNALRLAAARSRGPARDPGLLMRYWQDGQAADSPRVWGQVDQDGFWSDYLRFRDAYVGREVCLRPA